LAAQEDISGSPEEAEELPAKEQTENEKAEQEVEHMIYRLLEEDSLDEEDRRLKQLSDELQINTDELFGNFLHVLSVKKQLVKCLDMIMNERSKLQTLIITGTEGSGKTTLAKDIALFYFQSGKLKSSKLAKISADKLNTVDVLSKKEILKDCCLVVENASELKHTTIDNLLDLAGQLHGDIAIIFEEEKKNMNKLFREYPKLMDLLKNRIHLPQYNTEDLMGFAFACLRQKDYRLDVKAEQVLQGKINQIAKQSEPHRHLEQIYDLMQSAMDAADIRMGKQLSDLASQGRLKDVEAVAITIDDINVRP
jgi:energy-coupling factor transporter ATP-binding protein EcfA2